MWENLKQTVSSPEKLTSSPVAFDDVQSDDSLVLFVVSLIVHRMNYIRSHQKLVIDSKNGITTYRDVNWFTR